MASRAAPRQTEVKRSSTEPQSECVRGWAQQLGRLGARPIGAKCSPPPAFGERRSCDVDCFSTLFALDSQCRIVLERAAVFSHVRRTFGMQDAATVWLLNLGGVRLGDGYSVLEPTNVIAKYQAL